MEKETDNLTHRAALQACQSLLRSIARLLLKCGITWREFADLGKSVLVEVASHDYGIKGRLTNVSRVAILTGIQRKEVRRLRDLLAAEGPPLPSKTSDATRVLSAWHQDPDFTDARGLPRVLPESGPEASFELLCRRHGGDIPAGAVLKELLRVGAVEESADGLKVLRRYYMPVRFDPQWLLNAGSMLGDLGASITHNLDASARDPARFIGRATNETIDPALAAEFRAFIEAEGQQFLERVDAWLTAHETSGKRNGGGTPAGGLRVGVGVFAIQDKVDSQQGSGDGQHEVRS
ncbi:MAG: hypothetical protein FJ170_08335 [Gammaproteobacteria bacterium]|nr:hypothetical protein [Gammaproteobacteria bacterium]